jgi:hypothetical protein
VSEPKTDRAANAQLADSRWHSLYRIGAVAAVISVVVIPLTTIAFFVGLLADGVVFVLAGTPGCGTATVPTPGIRRRPAAAIWNLG